MASLNGVSLKNLKTYAGHEGEPCMQGSVYYNGKKLGFWSQDGHGGPDRFDFNENLLEVPVLSWKSDLKKSKYYEYLNIDSFMAVLGAISDLEKQGKKYLKQGFKTIAFGISLTDGMSIMLPGNTIKELVLRLNEIETELRKYTSDIDKSLFRFEVISLSDDNAFDIKVGSKDKVKEEKKKIEEEKEKRKKEYEEQRKKVEEAERKRVENKRFISKRSENDPSMIIKDTVTGKTTVVSLYAYKEVMDALIELFSD